MKFFLTDLGKDHFILGYPFLFTFNPGIDWRAAKLEGGGIRLETIGFRKAQRRVEQCQAAARVCVGHLEPEEVIWIKKLTMAQQWAHDARETQQEKQNPELPVEYRRHAKVFDEQQATHFPPEREEELKIKMLPGAPKEIDCKVYPLS